MTPQQFYQNYLADNTLSELSKKLIFEVECQSPKSILDFGCGTGKHIKSFSGEVVTCGLDVSLLNVIHASVKNDRNFMILGYDIHLQFLQRFDVVMTCSVLDHIKNINGIINEFKRIATKAVLLAETSDVMGDFYYAHRYEDFGFMKIPGFEWKGEDGATYYIYKWDRNEPQWAFAHDDLG
jgi:SAM-dependent methyltransferase